MTSLAVFDFDRTVVDDDSDATVIRLLSEKQPPPQWEQNAVDWTPYMENIFNHAYQAGFNKADILDSIGQMKPMDGIVGLITALHNHGWHIVLITDANTVFINHWLMRQKLLDKVREIITNRAHFDEQGCLHIEPCMNGHTCSRCPQNLCKTRALQDYRKRSGVDYDRVIYVGDGRNDYCPMLSLSSNDIVFPRRNHPCDRLIKNDSSALTAKCIPWTTSNDIIKYLFPDGV